jgi:hypothetical protein
MTKDGRPSLLSDIRHFYGIDGRGSRYLDGLDDAVAFGRRLAWFLNGERVSLGAYSALYLLFTSSVEPGAIRVTDEGGEWWQRYTYVGVPREFPQLSEASRLVISGTIDALKTIRSDLGETIEAAATVVASEREKLRFLLKSREIKRFIVEISAAYLSGPSHPACTCPSPTGPVAHTWRPHPSRCHSTWMPSTWLERSESTRILFASFRINPFAPS